ncbi:MAG: hypothetical protein ACFCVB_15290 [Nodosilinea sp.]
MGFEALDLAAVIGDHKHQAHYADTDKHQAEAVGPLVNVGVAGQQGADNLLHRYAAANQRQAAANK